ncbi:MAG: tape measure protein [Pseudomonadota bacterium]
MTRSRTKFILDGEDRTTQAFNSVKQGLVGLDDATRQLQRVFAFTAGAAGVGALVGSITSATLEFDSYRRTLRAVFGSQEAANREFEFAATLATRLGINLNATVESYAKLAAATRGTALAGQETRDIFESVIGASRVLGLSVSDTEGVLRAFQQIVSKGTVQAEELRGQIGERLPGAFGIAAKSIGVTTEELNEMLQRGEVLATDLLPKLADELNNAFGSELEEASQSAAASFQRLENSLQELKVAIGESGLVDALANSADFLAFSFRAASGSAGSFAGEAGKLEKQIEFLNEDIAELEENIRLYEEGGARVGNYRGNEEPNQVRVWRRGLAALREELESIKNLQNEVMLPREDVSAFQPIEINPPAAPFTPEEVEKNLNRIERTHRAFNNRWLNQAERFQRDMRLNEFFNRDDPEQLAKVRARLLERQFPEIDLGDLPDKLIVEPFEESFDQLNAIADQAARNMQTAFADFLFDPFEEGLDGMLSGFLDTIRRMAAESASLKIFEALDGSGILNSIIGLGGSLGGIDVAAGTAGVLKDLGNKGFSPKSGASVVIQQTVDIASRGLIETPEQLKLVLDESNNQVKAEISDLLNRGRI